MGNLLHSGAACWSAKRGADMVSFKDCHRCLTVSCNEMNETTKNIVIRAEDISISSSEVL